MYASVNKCYMTNSNLTPPDQNRGVGVIMTLKVDPYIRRPYKNDEHERKLMSKENMVYDILY
jgi:hypothetical protein